MDDLALLGEIQAVGASLRQFSGPVDKTTAEFVLELYNSDRSQFEAELEAIATGCSYSVADAVETFRQAPQRSELRPEPAPVSRGRKTLEVDKKHQVKVESIKPYGAFCSFMHFPSRQGLLHISQIEPPVKSVSDALQVGDELTTTITQIEGHRISLSMKSQHKGPAKPRLTSPERFEIRQLIAAGVLDEKDYPDLDEDHDQQDDQDVDVEVKQEVPSFLQGRQGSGEVDSVPTFLPVPDGTLAKSITKSGERPRGNIKKPIAPAKSAVRHPPKALQDQRRDLPVFKFRAQLLEAVNSHQIIIVQGDTGSGKTTQIAQYLYEEGYTAHQKLIGCTQPRRVAAVSIANRVAEEMGQKVGATVGYTIRFESQCSAETRIKYMTDGMFLREVVQDPKMSEYSVLILDEAHERTLSTDILFPLIKKACVARPDLKVIITSATIDASAFSTYFGDCPVYKIPGRTFPVEILYSEQPEFDYIDAALFKVMQIHMSQPEGDILVFLTGQDEIDSCCDILSQRAADLQGVMPLNLLVLPVYASLPSEAQSQIFDPAPVNTRKVIFATNIAETSITIDNIKYVVDTGVVKVNVYDSRAGMDVLKVVPVSRAQANQRAGRAGRTSPGKCYRLYTRDAYEHEMLATGIPEIKRQQLTSTILLLKAMNIGDIWGFDFMDKPSQSSIYTALESLWLLGAIDSKEQISANGRVISKFPVDPSMALVLLQSVKMHCGHEVLTILAMLSLPNIFIRTNEKDKLDAERKRRKFTDDSGDHLTLLNIYNAWSESGYSRYWCSEHYVQERAMRRAQHVRQQLAGILGTLKLRITSCQRQRDVVLRTFCCGYFRNTAKLEGEQYRTLDKGTQVTVHPSSVLFGKRHQFVLYHSLLQTSREYMTCVSVVRPAWLVENASAYFQPASTKRKRAEKIAPMLQRHEREDEWRLSAQRKFVKYESNSF